MSKNPTMTLIATLALLGLLTASLTASAGGIRQWTDPETGETVFGDAPQHAAAKYIRVQPSEGFSVCGDHCKSQALAIDLRDLTEKYRRDSACKRLWRHYTGDAYGAALGKTAAQECAEEKAREELGLVAGGGNARAEYGEHFEREGERRQRQNRPGHPTERRLAEPPGDRSPDGRDKASRPRRPHGTAQPPPRAAAPNASHRRDGARDRPRVLTSHQVYPRALVLSISWVLTDPCSLLRS